MIFDAPECASATQKRRKTMKKIPDKMEANIPALKNAVYSLIKLTEADGAINGSREQFQGMMANIDLIKWAIICEATALVRSGVLDEIEKRGNYEK